MARQVAVCRFLQGVGTQTFEMYGNQDTKGRVFKAASRPDAALQARDRICYCIILCRGRAFSCRFPETHAKDLIQVKFFATSPLLELIFTGGSVAAIV